ncbi:hypothetical protein CEW46_32030 [Bacillus cereus]|nr:hypothetical protein CEW46_32030 [Bacillus cereus]
MNFQLTKDEVDVLYSAGFRNTHSKYTEPPMTAAKLERWSREGKDKDDVVVIVFMENAKDYCYMFENNSPSNRTHVFDRVLLVDKINKLQTT